ncbi:acetyl-CoA synthetase-like protein [Auriculariales sp. MPI-PUGE-AT-0066]|nr:acetyl-CoA synthetase-like protein [Auriculariales sp. MPI-PUGE-AT-0066]
MWPKHEIVTPQAVGSRTFVSPPPLSGMTYPEVLDHNHDFNGSHSHFESVSATWKVAHMVQAIATTMENEPKPKFAILAKVDSITYTVVVNGILRAGYEVFLVSTRLSAPVVAEMLQKKGTTHVFVSEDPAMQTVLQGAQQILQQGSICQLKMPIFEEIFSKDIVKRPPMVLPSLDDTSIILHSSGSTSTPKLIPYTFRSFSIMGIYPYLSSMDHCMIIGWHVLPMFHIMGVFSMAIAAWTGATVAVYPPQTPPMVSTPDTALSHVIYTKAQAAIYPPVILQTLMDTKPEETISVLKNLRLVVYGGGPLNQAVGEALHKQKVTLGQIYGSTEVMSVAHMLPTPLPGEAWYWVHAHKGTRIHFRDLGDGTHEPVYMESEWHRNNVNNSEVDGVLGFASSDVVLRHPTLANSFRVMGRVDDQIVLSNGEKINPTALEWIFINDPHIAQVVSFGHGRPHGGVIIQPKPEFILDGRDSAKLREFKGLIAATVQKVNDYVPTHSRVMPEMIIITSPDRSFLMTSKDVPHRGTALKLYAADIDAAYNAFELSPEIRFAPPAEWTVYTTLEFIRSVVRSVVDADLQDDGDLFQHGCDSLRASWIRNVLASAVGKEHVNAVPRQFVYEYPTIAGLASALCTIVSGEPKSCPTGMTTAEFRAIELEKLVGDHSSNYSNYKGTRPLPDEKVFVITGTTGGLGSRLLHQLLADPTVKRVYALNRRSAAGHSLLTVHTRGFKERGLDHDALEVAVNVGRVHLVVADAGSPDLGIDYELYQELASSATHIIHNAWPVNFNYAIETFKPAIKRVRSLVDLALRSVFLKPPAFLFISSVSVVRNGTHSTPETYIDDVHSVVGFGYAESKWVAESILRHAAEATPLRPVSVRVGQLTGGENGHWNASDWVPSIVQSSVSLRCLPNWGGGILHLVHPRPVAWSMILAALNELLNLPIVTSTEWIRLLELENGDSSAVSQLPALKILDFVRDAVGARADGGSTVDGANLDSSFAQQISKTLHNMAPLTSSDVRSWVSYWRTVGLSDI